MRDFLLSRGLFLSIELRQGWEDNHIPYPHVPENLFRPANKYFSNPVIILIQLYKNVGQFLPIMLSTSIKRPYKETSVQCLA